MLARQFSLKPERLKLKLEAQFPMSLTTRPLAAWTLASYPIHVGLLQSHRHEFAAYRAHRTCDLVSNFILVGAVLSLATKICVSSPE
jgi:hypothetical protein